MLEKVTSCEPRPIRWSSSGRWLVLKALVNCLVRFRNERLKALFHSWQKPTRKLTLEKKTSIDPDKISEEIFPTL